MGNGHLNIGIGQGGATVYDNAPAVQNFADIVEQQKQQRDAQVKQLQGQLAKSSPAGIREPDRQGYMDKYSQLQSVGRQMINERDPYKKAQLQAQVDKGFQDLGGYVSDSKAGAANEKFIQQQGIKNKDFYNTFADDAHDKMMKSFNSPQSSPDYIKDFGSLQRQPDMDKFNKNIDDITKGVKENAVEDTDPLTGKYVAPKEFKASINGQTGTFTQSTKYVNQTEYAHKLLNYVTTNKDAPIILAKTYPQIAQDPNIPPEQKQAALVQAFIKDHPVENIPGQSKYQKPEKPDNFYAHEEWKQSHGIGSGAAKITPTYTTFEAGRQGNTQQAQQYLDNNVPKGQFKPGDKPVIQSNPDGTQTLHVPAVVKLDKSKQAYNEQLKSQYDKNPEKANKTLGMFGGDKVPFEKSSKYSKLQDPYTEVEKSKDIPLDPSDPKSYHETMGAALKQLKVPVSDIDKEAQATVRGKQPQASTKKEQTYSAQGGKKYTHTQLKAAGYTDAQIELAISEGTLK